MGGTVIGGEFMGNDIIVIQGIIHIGAFNPETKQTSMIPINNQTVKRHEVLNKSSERITNSKGSRSYNGSSFGGSHWRSRGGRGYSNRTTTSSAYKTFTILVEYTDGKNSVLKLEEDSYEMFLANVYSKPVAIDYPEIEEEYNNRKGNRKNDTRAERYKSWGGLLFLIGFIGGFFNHALFLLIIPSLVCISKARKLS